MSQGTDLESGLQGRPSRGSDPHGRENQFASNHGDQEHPRQRETSQQQSFSGDAEVDQTERHPTAVPAGPALTDRSNSQYDTEWDPDVILFDYIKNQDEDYELRTTSYKSSSEWIQDLRISRVQETSSEDLQVVFLSGKQVAHRLEEYLQYRNLPEHSVDRFCRLIESPLMPMANQTRSDHYYISWMKVYPFLAKKKVTYIDAPDGAMLVRRMRGYPLEIRLLAMSERLWCFQMPRTVVITSQSESAEFEEKISAFSTPSNTATTFKFLAAGLSNFKLQRGSSRSELLRFLQTRICQIAVDDEYEILSYIEQDLGRIDVEMSFETMGIRLPRMVPMEQTNINELKGCMGHWRRHILSRHNLQHCMEQIMKAVTQKEESGATNTPLGEDDLLFLQGALSGFGSKLDGTLRHFESTFSALIGTMSINESTRAFKEAEEITKLTQLAFVFIPLTFVAGIFGMNLKELADLNVWIWAVTSICLLATTYCILYPKRCFLIFSYVALAVTIPVWLIPTYFYFRFKDMEHEWFHLLRSSPRGFRNLWNSY